MALPCLFAHSASGNWILICRNPVQLADVNDTTNRILMESYSCGSFIVVFQGPCSFMRRNRDRTCFRACQLLSICSFPTDTES